MIDYFTCLGDTVLQRWQRRDFAVESFAAIARDALAEAPPADHVGADDIVQWVMSADDIGDQLNLDASFGQPPVTLYAHEKFYIEALFWLSSTTAIHEHAFAGAFSVLAGSSMEARYGFEARRELDDALRIGDLTLREVAFVGPGDVRTIGLGSELIHSVFHLEHPSVTIVVRTREKVIDQPQWTYYLPGVGFDAKHACPLTTRRLQVLSMLADTDSPLYRSTLRTAMATWPPYAVFKALGLVAEDDDDELFEELLALACARLGDDLAILRDVFALRRREMVVTTRRALITQPELRFFLALLLTLPDRDAIYRAISARYPNVDPRARALQWATEASGTDVVGIEFDELNCVLFESLLDGLAFDDAVTRLHDIYDTADIEQQRGELRAHYADMAASELFRPLYISSGGSGAAGAA